MGLWLPVVRDVTVAAHVDFSTFDTFSYDTRVCFFKGFFNFAGPTDGSPDRGIVMGGGAELLSAVSSRTPDRFRGDRAFSGRHSQRSPQNLYRISFQRTSACGER